MAIECPANAAVLPIPWIFMLPAEKAESSVAERLNRECRCVGTDIPALHRWLEDDLASRGLSRPKRVRNNLFHGGKHFGPTAAARDADLVAAAIAVLSACLVHSPAVLKAYRE